MRSILKHPHLTDLHYHQQCQPFPFASCASLEVSQHVHFPPTPTLTSTFTTHSASVYDRTPAEVPPNACALPGRHEREIVDTPNPRRTRRPWDWDTEDPKGSYFQPRGCANEQSDSDDSDIVRTPPEPSLPHLPIAVRFGLWETSEGILPYSPSQEEFESALMFLPHGPRTPSKVSRRSSSRGRSPPKAFRQENADGRIKPRSDFAVPTLDFEGCLGGF